MRSRGIVSLLGVVATIASACEVDPVRAAEIDALGGEVPGVLEGPEHRPGQPCVLCHAPGGPASGHPFAVAGTIHRTTARDSPPAPDVDVMFVDANGGAPRIIPTTNAAGNFFVRASEWPDLAFPIRVGLYDGENEPPKQTMQSLVSREGSCNTCHRREASTSSVGPVYFE